MASRELCANCSMLLQRSVRTPSLWEAKFRPTLKTFSLMSRGIRSPLVSRSNSGLMRSQRPLAIGMRHVIAAQSCCYCYLGLCSAPEAGVHSACAVRFMNNNTAPVRFVMRTIFLPSLRPFPTFRLQQAMCLGYAQ